MAHFVRTWNAAYEATPADTDNASEGANRIRDLKTDIQERMTVDHSAAGDESDGEHKQVTLIEAAADPANVANRGFLYTKDVSGVTELYYEDSDGNVTQITAGGTPGATGNSGQILATNAAETARIWWTPLNYIAGLAITSNGAAPTTDIDIAAGECADSGNTNILKPAAVTREVDGAYGTGNGGLSSSLTVAANTTYYIHAIRIGTTEDVGFDTSATAANLITDHSVTEYRQIGTFRTNSGDTDIDVSTIAYSVLKNTILGDALAYVSSGGNTGSNTYVKVAEHIVPAFGSLRIKFTLRQVSGSTAFGRIYINGVAIGTERSTTSGSNQTYSEDFTGINPGDKIQMYAKNPTILNFANIDNFNFYTSAAGTQTMNNFSNTL